MPLRAIRSVVFYKFKIFPLSFEFGSRNSRARVRIWYHLFLCLGLPNCIEKFDRLAEELLASDSSGYADIIQKAEKVLEESTGDKDKATGDIYVKIMKKIQEKGVDYVDSEVARVQKLLKDKITDKKKDQFKKRLDILTSFQHSKQSAKEEL